MSIFENIEPEQRPIPKSGVSKQAKLTILAGVVLVVVIAGVVWMLVRPHKKATVSTNPIIASYQQQLPGLADKAKKNPKDAQALQNYAVALYATGDVQKAKTQYESEVQLNGNDATLRNNLGNVYRDLGDYQKAVESYQKSIQLNPKNVNAYTNLANLYIYTLNKKDLGIKTYQDALNNLADNQELEVLLGIAYEQSDDKANAVATFQKVLTQNPNNAAAAAGLKRVQS
jgi:tetratricopeptide (TPR) repeat protein